MENVFYSVKRALTDEDLREFENENNIAMPLKIREHYLRFNGGYTERNVFYSTEDKRQYIINHFFSIGCGEGLAIEKTLPLLRDEKIFPTWLVPLANDEGGNLFAYSIRNGEAGAIYYYSHEFEYGEKPEKYIKYLSQDIDTFLNSLDFEEEEQ